MRGAGAFGLTLLLATQVAADEVYLHGGGRITGILVSQSPDAVEVEVGAGRITVPRSQVERIVEGETTLSLYIDRVQRLAAEDTTGWLALGQWADRAGLTTQARDAFERVLTLDPENAVAHRAMGHVRVEGHWLTHDEAMLAKGFVLLDGEWVSPEQREATLAQRAEEHRARAEGERTRVALAEAEARVREAEARARMAEAEAKRASRETEAFPRPFVLWSPACCNSWPQHAHCFRGHSSPFVVFPPLVGPPFTVPESHWAPRGHEEEPHREAKPRRNSPRAKTS